jgi:BA14K-like protein
MPWYNKFAAAVLVSGVVSLAGSGAGALPLSSGGAIIAADAESQTLTTGVQIRRSVGAPRFRSAPRIGAGPRVVVRPIIRPRPFVRRYPRVIVGIPSFYDWPYPYSYEPYYYEAPYDDAIAYCIQRYRSYDVRTRTYLGYDGLRHPCP